MQQKIDEVLAASLAALQQANDLKAVDDIRVAYLGKKGHLTELLKSLNTYTAQERPAMGALVNTAKDVLSRALDEKISAFKLAVLQEQLQVERLDVTLPARAQERGSLHPITHVSRRIEDIFLKMGFTTAEGPEIEDDYHNFTALNIPPKHPARAMQDTFYFPDGRLLRTQTSPVQIRTMQNTKPPIRIIAPGRVYRHDFDVTHTPMFHQVEGLLIDEHISFADLKGVLKSFFESFFSCATEIRLRPSYFPFTEPSAEADIRCVQCQGQGCAVCKHSGWLEVMGCGMVHPNVLQEVNIDPKRYSGFAFGIGIDRLAMLYFGIDDLRVLFENDLRFLNDYYPLS